jgi:AAHS family 4-hydroxybenzoate transporter-like MFS transporter
LGWSIGGTFAGLVGVFLTPHFGWEALYYVGAMSIPLTFVVLLVLPESPRYLASRGRIDELRRLLSRLRPEKRAIYALATLHSVDSPAPRNTLGALLAPRYRRLSITIWLTAFLSLFSIFGLTGWTPTVMMQRGETFAASFGFGAVMQAMSFIGGLALAMLVDHRLPLAPRFLAVWWTIGGLAIIALVFASGHLANLTIVAAAGFCIIGAQHVLNNFAASSYDTSVRASGVGMELGIGRIGAVLGPFAAGLLQQETGGPEAVFWAIGVAAIIAGCAVASLGSQASTTA